MSDVSDDTDAAAASETHGLLAAHSAAEAAAAAAPATLYERTARTLLAQAQQRAPPSSPAPTESLRWKRRRGGTRPSQSPASPERRGCLHCLAALLGSNNDHDGDDDDGHDGESGSTVPRQTLCRAPRAELDGVLLPLAALPYDAACAEHRALFDALGALLDVPPGDARALGFQGADPGSDLRGVGMLGALQLLAFAERHNSLARALLAVARTHSRGGSDPFPLAATLLNITRFIFTVLVDGDGADAGAGAEKDARSQLATMCNASGSVLDTANNVYAAAAFVLLNTWFVLSAAPCSFTVLLALMRMVFGSHRSKGCYRVVDMTDVLAAIEHDICTAPQALAKQLFTEM